LFTRVWGPTISAQPIAGRSIARILEVAEDDLHIGHGLRQEEAEVVAWFERDDLASRSDRFLGRQTCSRADLEHPEAGSDHSLGGQHLEDHRWVRRAG
jgi:hypothetical protein